MSGEGYLYSEDAIIEVFYWENVSGSMPGSCLLIYDWYQAIECSKIMHSYAYINAIWCYWCETCIIMLCWSSIPK